MQQTSNSNSNSNSNVISYTLYVIRYVYTLHVTPLCIPLKTQNPEKEKEKFWLAACYCYCRLQAAGDLK